jgi:hypothetical protein
LEGSLIGEVNQSLFELNELLDGGESRLDPEQRLIYGALNREQLAGGDLGGRHTWVVRRVWMRLVVKMEVLMNAGLAERNLVGHAESVNDGVVLVAKKHSALLGASLGLRVHHLRLPRM